MSGFLVTAGESCVSAWTSATLNTDHCRTKHARLATHGTKRCRCQTECSSVRRQAQSLPWTGSRSDGECTDPFVASPLTRSGQVCRTMLETASSDVSKNLCSVRSSPNRHSGSDRDHRPQASDVRVSPWDPAAEYGSPDRRPGWFHWFQGRSLAHIAAQARLHIVAPIARPGSHFQETPEQPPFTLRQAPGERITYRLRSCVFHCSRSFRRVCLLRSW